MRANVVDYLSPAETSQTAAFQRAMDACRDAGGGEVYVPGGEYEIAGLRLYSGCTLRLGENARLTGSRQIGDYPDIAAGSAAPLPIPRDYHQALLFAVDAENLAIVGEAGSEIDGADCVNPQGEEGFRGPMGILLCRCRGVSLRGYAIRRTGNYAHFLVACQNVAAADLRVREGHDGVHMWNCENVLLERLEIATGDDCVAGLNNLNLTVRDCHLNSSCQNFRIGCMNLLVDNCRLSGPGQYPHRLCGRDNTLCAFLYFALNQYAELPMASRDSGHWLIRDCEVDATGTLLRYECGNRGVLQDGRPLREVRFENLRAVNLNSTSLCHGNGTPIRLEIEGATISFRREEPIGENGCHRRPSGLPLAAIPALLDLDDSVELRAHGVRFEGEGTLAAAKHEK